MKSGRQQPSAFSYIRENVPKLKKNLRKSKKYAFKRLKNISECVILLKALRGNPVSRRRKITKFLWRNVQYDDLTGS